MATFFCVAFVSTGAELITFLNEPDSLGLRINYVTGNKFGAQNLHRQHILTFTL